MVGKFVCSSVILMMSACISLGKKAIEHFKPLLPLTLASTVCGFQVSKKDLIQEHNRVFKPTFPRSQSGAGRSTRI